MRSNGNLLYFKAVFRILVKYNDNGIKRAFGIEDQKRRREEYRAIVMRGVREELVGMINVYEHGEKQKEIGKKMHAQDERILSDAERILYDEFSVVLGIARDEILDYIKSRVRAAK